MTTTTMEEMEQSVLKQTGFDKFLFSFKIVRISDSQQKEKKRKEK